jgi:hypothetical protein
MARMKHKIIRVIRSFALYVIDFYGKKRDGCINHRAFAVRFGGRQRRQS